MAGPRFSTYTKKLFETDNAHYCLNRGKHYTTTDPGTFDFDALALEGVYPAEPCCEAIFDGLKEATQYSELMKVASRKRSPIFLVDMPLTCSKEGYMFHRAFEFVSHWTLATAGAVSLLYGNYPMSLLMPMGVSNLTSRFCGENKTADELISRFSLFDFWNYFTGYRSAAAARKLDGIVVPEMRARLGRKPKIFVDYGGGHGDIEHYLKHRHLRGAVLGFHEMTPMRFLSPYDLWYGDVAIEFKPSELDVMLKGNMLARSLLENRGNLETVLYKIK